LTQHAKEIRGKHVVALQEGRDMGWISKVFFDPEKKRIAGLAIRESHLKSEEKWVQVNSIEQIGEDFVFIKRSRDCQAIKPTGRSLKDLTGLEVTTMDGKILGSLEDVEVDQDWSITDLDLSGKKTLALDPDSDVFGRDAVLVRVGSADGLRENKGSARHGLLARLFAGESIFEPVEHKPGKSAGVKHPGPVQGKRAKSTRPASRSHRQSP
jgi:sporulation protein YlmC with PRC-barrel domain